MELTVAKIRLALTVVFIFSFLFNFEKMHAIALVQKYGIACIFWKSNMIEKKENVRH